MITCTSHTSRHMPTTTVAAMMHYNMVSTTNLLCKNRMSNLSEINNFIDKTATIYFCQVFARSVRKHNTVGLVCNITGDGNSNILNEIYIGLFFQCQTSHIITRIGVFA